MQQTTVAAETATSRALMTSVSSLHRSFLILSLGPAEASAAEELTSEGWELRPFAWGWAGLGLKESLARAET